MTTPLDEKALRRETFSEGPKVTLGDGQEWTFPAPYPTMHTQVVEGKVAAGASLSYGPDYLDRIDDLIEAEDGFDRMVIMLELAAGLLLRNYSLDNRALRRLISIDRDAPPEMWREVQDVLLGRAGPKPSADGTAPPSGPSATDPAPSPSATNSTSSSTSSTPPA